MCELTFTFFVFSCVKAQPRASRRACSSRICTRIHIYQLCDYVFIQPRGMSVKWVSPWMGKKKKKKVDFGISWMSPENTHFVSLHFSNRASLARTPLGLHLMQGGYRGQSPVLHRQPVRFCKVLECPTLDFLSWFMKAWMKEGLTLCWYNLSSEFQYRLMFITLFGVCRGQGKQDCPRKPESSERKDGGSRRSTIGT